jgi:ATP-dependent protease ClpP protease subunit
MSSSNPVIAQDLLAERLYKARAIIISGGIDQELSERVTTQLLAMASESKDPITLYLNSQGGHVEAGDTIHDMIQFVDAPVRIVGTGWVASAGALIYVSVPRERRFCPTRASCCTSRRVAWAARRRTSPSKRARSSRCASA